RGQAWEAQGSADAGYDVRGPHRTRCARLTVGRARGDAGAIGQESIMQHRRFHASIRSSVLVSSLLLGAPLASVAAQSAPADGSRTWVEATAKGVFTHTEPLPDAPGAAAALTASRVTLAAPAVTNPNPSVEGLRWTYAAPAATPWITESVSCGNRGSLAWLGQNLNGQRLSLLATTENGAPPSPVYEDPLT